MKLKRYITICEYPGNTQNNKVWLNSYDEDKSIKYYDMKNPEQEGRLNGLSSKTLEDWVKRDISSGHAVITDKKKVDKYILTYKLMR
jgi:hypothetical protein